MKEIRVLVVEDHALLRQGFRQLLAAEPGISVAGEASDGSSAITLAAKLVPDVVVMDISMPNIDGIEATRQIRRGRMSGDGPIVIALSANKDGRYATEMFQVGARGFVSKDAAFGDLVRTIREAVRTEMVHPSPKLRAGVAADAPPGPQSLTQRERETLALYACGRATKEIAMMLRVSVKTIEVYRRNLMEKLGIDSVAGLTRYAVQEGLTTLEDTVDPVAGVLRS